MLTKCVKHGEKGRLPLLSQKLSYMSLFQNYIGVFAVLILDHSIIELYRKLDYAEAEF